MENGSFFLIFQESSEDKSETDSPGVIETYRNKTSAMAASGFI